MRYWIIGFEAVGDRWQKMGLEFESESGFCPWRSPALVCSIRCAPPFAGDTTVGGGRKPMYTGSSFIYYTGKRHPRELGATEVSANP